MYKVSFDDNEIFFSSDPAPASAAACRVITQLPSTGPDSIAKVLEKLENSKRLWIKTDDPAQAFARFGSWFFKAEAAGGLVQNDRGDSLMIYRNNRWDLPKGHLEDGETPEQCAVREVMEECGLREVSLGELLARTRHIYYMRERWTIKLTHWYAMHSNQRELTPQTAEGVAVAEWVIPEQVDVRLRNSYPTIREVFEAGLKRMRES